MPGLFGREGFCMSGFPKKATLPIHTKQGKGIEAIKTGGAKLLLAQAQAQEDPLRVRKIENAEHRERKS